MRRSARQRTPAVKTDLGEALRDRGTGKAYVPIAKRQRQPKTPHGNTLGERAIRAAATKRARPLFNQIKQQTDQVLFVIVIFLRVHNNILLRLTDWLSSAWTGVVDVQAATATTHTRKNTCSQ